MNSPKEITSKKKYASSGEDNTLLNFWDHFLLCYFPCCIYGRKLKISNYYQKVEVFIDEYTDMLNITNNIYELEKLKYLLLDEDQIAIFNIRSKINVERDEANISNFSKGYYFVKDLNDGIDEKQIMNELELRTTQKKLNKRLIDSTK